MVYEFKQTRRIEFVDTDLGGIVHFSNFFRYMEAAEHAFYRSLGLGIHMKTGAGDIGLPRVSASCEWFAPLRFDDELEIQLLVSEKREKSVSYVVNFNKLENGKRTEIARGTMSAVSVAIDPKERKMKAIPIPVEFADQIEVAPAELLKKKN